MGSFLYNLIIMPIEYLMDIITYRTYEVFSEAVITLVVLSAAVNVLTLPLYNVAEKQAAEEKKRQDEMAAWKQHIQKSFTGDERSMILQRYYRLKNYHPIMALRGSLSLLLQIPFFMAAYNYISSLRILQRVGAWMISDLATEDGLLAIGNARINLLPILMTLINFISAFAYEKGPGKFKKLIQPYAVAIVFLILLYHSPSGLVLYWILNNLFSLGKNLYKNHIQNKKLFITACLSMLPILYIYHDAIALEKSDWLTGYNNYLLLVCSPLIIYLGSLLIKKTDFSFGDLFVKQQPGMKQILPLLAALAVFMGMFIPLGVIGAAPWDFVSVFEDTDALGYCVQCILIYSGLFIFWGSVIFAFAGEKRKSIYALGTMILFIFVADHFLNSGRYGMINKYLVFDIEPMPSAQAVILNLAIVAVVAAVVLMLLKYLPGIMRGCVNIVLVAALVMSVYNFVRIRAEFDSAENKLAEEKQTDPEEDDKLLSLDRNEKNVIVIMLDRAISSYMPWIFEEKPELKQAFDGFTYYPDCLSFAFKTLYASGPLFGGYEYMPEHINERDDELLVDKQNEALSVMPVLFGRNDMDVVVADLPFAGYTIPSDMSIFDRYENVQGIYLEGRFGNDDINEKIRQVLQGRMFVLYSVFDVMPSCFSRQLYDRGNYQSVMGREHDVYPSFTAPYKVLEKMPEITQITDDGRGKAIIMANNTTHELADLQLPDYVPVAVVDNSEYMGMSRINDKGESLVFTTTYQEMHYKIDMAAMLKLADYFDYLRDQGVYDNTRIILVSDHGADLKQFEDFQMFNGSLDLTLFNPLLMVKDFGATGWSVSDEFMTDADVPILALEGVVDEPVNPFTGKVIENSEKQGVLHVTATFGHDGVDYIPMDKHVFDTSDAPWYSVHDSIFDEDNWSIWKERGETSR